MRFVYFVSYALSKHSGDWGYGNLELELSEQITEKKILDDAIQNHFKNEKDIKDVIVLYFTPLNEIKQSSMNKPEK